jgi:hypothetical protein
LHPQRDRSARTALRVVTNIRKPTVGTSRELSLKRRQTEGAMLDFEDDASAVLGFRLMAIQLPPPPWLAANTAGHHRKIDARP